MELGLIQDDRQLGPEEKYTLALTPKGINFCKAIESFLNSLSFKDLSRNLCKLKPDVPGHSFAEKNRQLI